MTRGTEKAKTTSALMLRKKKQKFLELPFHRPFMEYRVTGDVDGGNNRALADHLRPAPFRLVYSTNLHIVALRKH